MTRDRKDIDAALKRKGFQHYDGDHHYYLYINLAGRKTLKKTRISHGSSHKSISDSLLGQMARQVGLSKAQFLQLVDCPLSRVEYENLVFSSKNSPG